jgi:hypothetical protein
MDTKKKPTKEEVAYAKKKLAEAKQKAADYDARMAEEKKKAPFPGQEEKVASFEDIKLRSSSSELPINKGVKIRAEDLEKIEADPWKVPSGEQDWNDYNPDLYDPTKNQTGWFEGDLNARPQRKPKPVAKEPEAESKRPEEVLVVEGMVPKGIAETEEQGKKGRYEKRKPVDPKIQIMRIADLLLKSESTKYSDVEMEVKFGTRGIKRLTKTDYDNVVKKLYSVGFTTINPSGIYALKIQPEFLDLKSGTFKISRDFDRFRVELLGLENIQEYCQNGNIQKIFDTKLASTVSIMKKTDVFINEEPVQSADFNDFNFRVTYKNEEKNSANSKIGKELISNWDKTKKQFRYINRVTFTHRDLPFKVDLSIVRSSTKDNKGQLIKTYNVIESNVFKNQESYEIEIEVENYRAKQKYRNAEQLVADIQKVTKFVLCGLQKTSFPVSYPEQKETIAEYMKVVHEEDMKKQGKEYIPKDRAYPSDFIGPSSKTLQIKNIGPVNPDMVIPNITAPFSYCVTDKADGDRHMMFINSKGKIYLINMQMEIIFTGARTEEMRCFNSIIDGELILHDKNGAFINIFAAFDIYFASSTDLRARPFMEVPYKNKKIFEQSCRLAVLKEFMTILNPTSILSKSVDLKSDKLTVLLGEYKKRAVNKSPMNFITKNFYPVIEKADVSKKDKDESAGAVAVAEANYNIFAACNFILQRVADNLYEYNTDGLIFTPTLFGVGGNTVLEAGPLRKIRWDYSFKWKPPKYNTIDFLVSTKKGADGQDITTPIFENGLNVMQSTQFNQYKTLILQVGFDEKRHGYINPCQDILDDKMPEVSNEENEETYKRKQFFPSDPFDVNAGLCNIMLETDGSGNPQMFTEEREVINDETVVEFRYDLTREGLWKWIPLRVRYDKTTEFRNGKISCNDYDTANDNWYSIHNPISERMIATGQDIPEEILSDEIYYNRVTSEKQTMGLRDFHNLFVKKILIRNVSRNGNTLIDFACGQGGDLPKWIAANLSFVFGIDISKNNIENRVSGACARYLSFRKDFQTMPYALFVVGNSALNVRSGKAMATDKGNAITQAVFGQNALDSNLGPAVKRQYAKGEPGFDISSCQFAIHYMFENKHTFYNFMRNIAECTREGGYFIGTCYDGKTIFNKLRMKQQGEGDTIYHNERKVWSLTKDYDSVSYENNITSLGYKISVYQESINQTIPEYLVNFDFLVETMSNYGFRLLPRDDAKKIGLPEGSGLFIEMYNKMMDEIRKYPKTEKEYGMAPNMMDYEKRISFLNRYFVFQKIATRNVEKLTKSILEQLPEEIEFEDRQTEKAQKVVAKVDKELKPKVKNLKKKLLLQGQDVELNIEDEDKATKKEVVVVEETKEVEAKAVEHVLETIASNSSDKKKKVKKTKKAEEDINLAEKKKTTRKKKVLIGDINEE